MLKTHTQLLIVLTVTGLFSARLAADVVDTKNGAHIVGKITKIDDGTVFVSTDFAGDLKIKQSEVTSMTSDKPVSVRLSSGTRIEGQLGAQNGSLQIAGSDGTITTSVTKVAAAWEAGGKDPQIAALERHWTYEATVDINGTSGNKDQLGTQAGLRAKLVTQQDTLQYYTGYNRQVTDGSKSADQFKAGVDYSDNFDANFTWFVRDEGGFDRIMNIRFYDTAAAGGGVDFIKNTNQLLTGRVGLAYRYDGYYSILTPTVNSAAADFELASDFKFTNSEVVTHLTAVPAFSDLNNYIINHDTFYQIPLANPAWKLRMGVSNDYNSKPGAGFKKLDTSYYTRLILDWE